MPLLSFEGVEVDVPTALAGVQFAFVNGALSIQCTNFTGAIVMTKPASMALRDFPAAAAVVQTSKKRSTPDDLAVATESDDSDAELLRKRLRPNFLSDVEQTMLLAQLEASQPSSASADVAPTPSPAPAPSDQKTPAKTKKAPSVSHMKSFFSPEPKDVATKKTDVTPVTKKTATARAPAAKAKGESASQISIRDMMLQTTPVKTTPVVQALPPTATWSVMETSGAIPTERWGHTVTKISDDRVVVYGGADDDETTLGDLHVLDLATQTWSTPLNCESIPRTWHDAVHLASKNLLLVFGGERAIGDDQLDVLSDIMVLDTECFLWYPPAVSGTPPTARSGHACTVVGNDVIVFGGSRGRSRQSSVHVLDSDAWHWKSVKVEGKPPSARTYHSAVAVGDDSVVYFGGNDATKSFDSVHVLKKSRDKRDVWTWFHPCVVGTAPRARTGHSATLVDSSKILIFGGWDPQAAATTDVFDDAFLLDTVSWEWERLDVAPSAVPGRVGHCAVLGRDGKTVLLLGGQDATERRLNVVHALTLGGADSGSASESGDSSVPATQASA